MSKLLIHAAAAALTAFLPGTAAAAGIIFDASSSSQAAGWKPVGVASSTGEAGYWDRRSYDSATNARPGACGAGTLVGGVTCDWQGPDGVRDVTSPSIATPGVGFEYFGLLDAASAGADAPLNFFFTGPFEFDWTVLFQLTAWADGVEFGWYEAGNPENRTPVFGPGGPYTTNDGTAGLTGTASIPTGDFGFYYRNSRFGSGDVLFFTESRFNRTGGYFAYFAEWGDALPARFEDEATFAEAHSATGAQQFVVFRQGNRYWLGLEDQIGRIRPSFCSDLRDQPCSDYDFNDFVIGWTERQTVPEPASLTLIAGALCGLAWRYRRRA